MKRTQLSLGYDVVLVPDYGGLAVEIGRFACTSRLFVVTNPLVKALHGGALAAELEPTFKVEWFVIPDGETYKSLATWSGLVGEMLAARPDRNTLVLAFGGGVVGDLAGFAASTVLRGLRLVQLPTTLLAMVDSSVGGKTAVNVPEGKNLLGTFYQPSLVWASMASLQTLSEAELRCGLGEVVKHAMLDGPAAVEACETAAEAVVARDAVVLARVVDHSVRFKARIVEADPTEKGVRALLNLGHTIAHGVEACVGYGELRHGEAVAIGLVAINRYAVQQSLALPQTLARVEDLIRKLGLPTAVPKGISAEQLVAAMRFDKKRGRGMVKLVVPFEFGDVRVCEVDERELVRLAQLAVRGDAMEGAAIQAAAPGAATE